MKHIVWFALLLSIPAFAQDVPGNNIAARNLEKRLDSLKLFPAPTSLRSRPAPTAIGHLDPRKPCAMPLLNATPPGTSDTIPTVSPATPSAIAPTDPSPAPACYETFLRNR